MFLCVCVFFFFSLNIKQQNILFRFYQHFVISADYFPFEQERLKVWVREAEVREKEHCHLLKVSVHHEAWIYSAMFKLKLLTLRTPVSPLIVIKYIDVEGSKELATYIMKRQEKQLPTFLFSVLLCWLGNLS